LIRSNDGSIKEQIKQEVLKEVQRILLIYEERLAVLERERDLLLNRVDDLELEVEALTGDIEDLKITLREVV
jgi:phage baseplate assembly protein W